MHKEVKKKKSCLQKRRVRIRKRLQGTADRPRLAITRTNTKICAQLINDVEGRAIAGWTSRNKALSIEGSKKNKKAAELLGAHIAKEAKAKGVEQIVFDRGGSLYHGVIAALADKARENGLRF